MEHSVFGSALHDPAHVRAVIARGQWTSHTRGLAPGYAQANLVVVPAKFADQFAEFCTLNPKPCPLLARSQPGEVALPAVGVDDIRSELPRYIEWRDGDPVAQHTDVATLWRDDLVTFLIGCSFSFEEALRAHGVPLRDVEQGKNVAMYRTQIETRPSGPFRGPLVVSMRPLSVANAIKAIAITAHYPRVHGAPVHLGSPAEIGICDIDRPDYGDRVEVKRGEVPVFWACGVTPQAAVQAAKIDFCITHAPGSMLVTNVLNTTLASCPLLDPAALG